jgi:hypothetical protein
MGIDESAAEKVRDRQLRHLTLNLLPQFKNNVEGIVIVYKDMHDHCSFFSINTHHHIVNLAILVASYSERATVSSSLSVRTVNITLSRLIMGLYVILFSLSTHPRSMRP